MGFESVRLNSLKPWLNGPEARAHEGAMGEGEDTALDGVKEAVKLQWPLDDCVATTDEAGLASIAETRRHIIYPNEDGERARNRLARAPLNWYWSGTLAGLTLPFEPAFHSFRYYPPTEELRRLDPVRDAAMISLQTGKGRIDPGLWVAATPPSCEFIQVLSNGQVDGFWDGNEDWFSRVFWIVDSYFTDPGIWSTDDAWDAAGDWDDGGLWDTTMSHQEATYLRATIRRHKSVGSYPVTVAIVLLDKLAGGKFPVDGFWGSPGLWDDGDNWADIPTSDPLYLTIGHVWGEENWLGAFGEYPLTDVWPNEDDNLGGWVSYEGDPLQR